MQIKLHVQVVRGSATPSRSRRRRRIVAAAVVAAALAAPLAYAAVRNDVFTDVPSTAADHDAINRVYNAGIMKPCNTSPMQFCPNSNLLRRGAAVQYDRAFGLSGAAGNFTPTFRAVNIQTPGGAPLTVNSTVKVANLNADALDSYDATDLGPRAYAYVNPGPSPTLNLTRSKNATEVLRFFGIYCVIFDPAVVDIGAASSVATLSYSSDGGSTITAWPEACSSGGRSGVQVETFDANHNDVDNLSFTVMIP